MIRAFGVLLSTLGIIMLCHVAIAQPQDLAWMRGGHEGGVRAVAGTSDGAQLYSSSTDGNIKIMELMVIWSWP